MQSVFTVPKEGEVRANECAPAVNEDAKAMIKEVLEEQVCGDGEHEL